MTGPTGPSGPSGPKGAILETSAGWVGFWAMEASEVLLIDGCRVRLDASGTACTPIHGLLLECCEEESIRPLSAVPSEAGPCGVEIADTEVIVTGPPGAEVALWLAGVRKGQPGRFIEVSEARARRNNAFWAQAWK